MVHLREADADDALLISRIIAASWRSAYRGLIDEAYLTRLPDEYWLSPMRTWLASGRMYGYVAELDGHSVGCIIYGRGRDEAFSAWGEIVSLYLLPEIMGNGVGKTLLQAALQALREEGYHRFYLWAIDGNDHADGFYCRHGFYRTTEQVRYRIGGQDVTDVRYTLED